MSCFETIGHRRDWTLTLVGEGDMYERLVRFAQNFPVGTVRVRGFVQAEQLPSLLSCYDVLLFPTRGDPYGLVINEAMASGMVVASSDHAGEVTKRLGIGYGQERGYIFKAFDVDDFRKVVLSIVDSWPHARRLGTYAQEFAEKELSLTMWTDCVRHLQSLLLCKPKGDSCACLED